MLRTSWQGLGEEGWPGGTDVAGRGTKQEAWEAV